MTDANDRRREPKGIPTGGRFAKGNGGGSDASDLVEETPASIPDAADIRDTPASREALLELARTMSSWDGSCDWADATEPEELMSGLGFDPAAAMTLIDAVGDDYYPTREFVRFTDAGMLESVNESDPKALLQAAREGNRWDGAFDWVDATDDIESLSGVYGSGRYDAQWLVDRAFFGDYEPGHDYIRFDGYGNFESIDESDLEQEAWDNREEILDAVQSARDDMDFTSWTDDDVADSLAKLDINGED